MYEKFRDFQLSVLGLFLALAVIISSIIVSDNISKHAVSVTGSAYEIVKSDTASWIINIEVRNPKLAEGHRKLKTQIPIVKKYLINNGIKPEQIDLMPSTSYEIYRTNPNTGNTTNDIAYYNINQSLKVNSDDVENIKKLSTSVRDLVESGISINSESPEYQYSKLGDLKIRLLESATTDAKNRANAMLKSNHNRIGKIQSVKMGVFQITPPDSNSVSDMGISDLSTIDKKVTAVANVVFSIK